MSIWVFGFVEVEIGIFNICWNFKIVNIGRAISIYVFQSVLVNILSSHKPHQPPFTLQNQIFVIFKFQFFHLPNGRVYDWGRERRANILVLHFFYLVYEFFRYLLNNLLFRFKQPLCKFRKPLVNIVDITIILIILSLSHFLKFFLRLLKFCQQFHVFHFKFINKLTFRMITLQRSAYRFSRDSFGFCFFDELVFVVAVGFKLNTLRIELLNLPFLLFGLVLLVFF